MSMWRRRERLELKKYQVIAIGNYGAWYDCGVYLSRNEIDAIKMARKAKPKWLLAGLWLKARELKEGGVLRDYQR